MQVSLLLDENIAAALATKLDNAGAVEENRIIVTSDDDFVELPLDAHSGVFYTTTAALRLLFERK